MVYECISASLWDAVLFRKLGLLSSRSRYWLWFEFSKMIICPINSFSTDSVCWCIIPDPLTLGESDLLSTRSRLQNSNIWSFVWIFECSVFMYHVSSELWNIFVAKLAMLTVHSKCILSKEFRVVYQGQGLNDHLSHFFFLSVFSQCNCLAWLGVKIRVPYLFKAMHSNLCACAICMKTVHLSFPFVPLNHNMNQAPIYICLVIIHHTLTVTWVVVVALDIYIYI